MATTTDTKVTLYWLDKSRSQRILWLLEELNVPYEVKTFKRGKDMRAPKELKEIHPLGKSPVISVRGPGSSKPIVIAESGMIIEYICDHFGGDRLIPTRYADGKEKQIGGETEEWLRYRYYMHFAEGSLMPFLVFKLVTDTVKNPPGVPFFLKPIPRLVAGQIEDQFVDPNLFRTFDFLEDQLKTAPGGGPFFCGDKVTAADIMMSFPLVAANTRMPLQEKYPHLARYVEEIEKQDGYKRAIAKIEEVDGTFEASL
ncbi:glutathione S-transferase [Aspergillus karnatakaensis]|uniref:glutathione S-transferase n=1 Tax=Aspergillus karnatakaensis TaxID=1810916 RepID=UPI003CCD2B11